MTIVTITDENARIVLVRAAWAEAVTAIGNIQEYYVTLDDPDSRLADDRETVARRVEMYHGAVALMAEIEGADVGATVKIDAGTEGRGIVKCCGFGNEE